MMAAAGATNRDRMAGSEDTTVVARPGAPCPYFGWYGFLPQHQNLLLDHVRTGAYRNAVQRNGPVDFLDQVVMDCGCGCGALGLFAVQAGAKRVYAVEASRAAEHAKKLCRKAIEANQMVVLQAQVEELQLGGVRVDVILCEGMGNLLLHERMMESFLVARDRFLKPGGKMYPSRARLHFAPFQDPFLRQAVVDGPSAFWTNGNYLGLDLRPLHETAVQSYLSQPLIGLIEPGSLLGAPSMHEFDLYKACEEDLQTVRIQVETIALRDGLVEGLVGWFDVAFDGSNWQGWLSTAPGMPPTHWQQVKCLLTAQLPVGRGDKIWGHVDMKANASRSYDVWITLRTEKEERSSVCIQLQNPGYYPFPGTVD